MRGQTTRAKQKAVILSAGGAPSERTPTEHGLRSILTRRSILTSTPLRHDCLGKARGCPSPACLQKNWCVVVSAPRFCALARPPFIFEQTEAAGTTRKVWVPTYRILIPVASAEYPDACMARGSQPVGGQALRLVCLQRAKSLICCRGVRAHVSASACE